MTDDQNDDGPRAPLTSPQGDESRSGVPASTLTPEIASEVIAALKAGHAIVCYMKCWPCQFGQHTDSPHTWMDDEDTAHAGIVLTGHASRARIATEHPCGCHCNEAHR